MSHRIIERLRLFLTNPYDGRPLGEVYADPGTPESFILRTGLRSPAAVHAALSRPDKSLAMIRALADAFAAHWSWLTAEQSDAAAGVLVADPALDRDGLLAVARSLHSTGRQRSPALLAAVVSHRLANPDVLVNALWMATQDRVRAVADVTGSIGVVALWWVCRGYDWPQAPPGARSRRDGDGDAVVRTRATTTRWAARVAGNPALAAFVLAAAFDFTDEETLFAAGSAICAAPARP